MQLSEFDYITQNKSSADFIAVQHVILFTNDFKVGQIISNDPTGRVLDPDEVIEGNSYKAAALPVGTKVSFVEKIPGKSVSRCFKYKLYYIIYI